MEILDAIVGPFGAVVALAVAVWAFFTGKVRRESEVLERDRLIEVLRNELAAERAALQAERDARKAVVAEVSAVVSPPTGTPLV